MVFGQQVYCSTDKRVMFFDASHYGALGINRDDHDGGVNYPIEVGTNPANGNDAYLTQGGVWTDRSSKCLKDRYVKLDSKEVLDKIMNMEIVGWYYKGTNEYHIWPFAEDFYDAFGTGVENVKDARTHIAPGDIAGVGLIAIQELEKQIIELKKELEELKEENCQLKTKIKELLNKND